MNGPDTPGTFTPRGMDKGFIGNQIEAFAHMQALGLDIVDSLTACLQGHRMTEDLAALCIATYWRRYTAIAQYQENRGAAITLQAAFRGMSTKSDHKAQKEAAAKLAAVFRGRKTRESTTDDLAQYRAATRLQAGWRAHLARGFVDRLRWQSKSRLQRTFSWSKKGGKRDRPAIKKRTEKEILEGMGVESNRPKAPVRRSTSFNRFSKGTKSIVDDGRDEKAKEKPANSKQLLFILLQRGPTGLGLELDATNTVVNIVPGGAADTQGYFREGDTIASVDGIPLRGRLLQDVMDRSKNSYSFDVWRLTPVEREPEVKKLGKVRRAFSFDRKR